MAGFPIAWDDGVSDQVVPSSACPYAEQEVEEYLRSCHYHWALEEPPLEFRVSGLVLFRQEVGRNYWLFSVVDGLDRQWFVVVGSGASPFDPSKKMWRWMYADRNDLGQTGEEYMDDTYAEQLLHDMRDRH